MSNLEQLNTPSSEHLPTMGRYTRLMTVMGVMTGSAIPEILSKTGEMRGIIERNVLPEPWDIPDHIGNFNEGGLYTVGAFSLFANLIARRSTGENYPSKMRQAAVGAFAVSSAIQILGEKYGEKLGLNHGDMIDSAYGIVFSALAVVVCNYGYQKAYKDDVNRRNHFQKQTSTASALSPQRPATANGKPSAKRASPQSRKNTRKQQRASRKKNR